MSEITYLTKEGYDKIKAKLTDLKTKGRQEAAQAIQKAREMGDLSENAEYDAAKDAQGLLELEISKLEATIANARILDASTMGSDKVHILSNVKIKNLKNGAVLSYKLVAEQEADLKFGKISIKSPVGKALLGGVVGDTVDVITPGGAIKFEILEINMDV